MSPGQRITVSLQHDNVLTTAGLQHIFGRFAEFEVVEDAAGGDAPPALLLTDFAQALALLSTPAPRPAVARPPRVLVIARRLRDLEIRRALRLGVGGIIDADCEVDDLVMGARQVHSGQVYLCGKTARVLAEGLHQQSLTSREEAVLGYLAAGMCNKEIAVQLDVAVGTVKSHLRSVFSKLGVESRTQAVMVADQRGLVPTTAPRAGREDGGRTRGHGRAAQRFPIAA